jgi:hypothetical protein
MDFIITFNEEIACLEAEVSVLSEGDLQIDESMELHVTFLLFQEK